MVEIEFIVSKEEDLKNWLKFIKNSSAYGNDWFKDYPEDFKNSLVSASDSKKVELIDKYTKKFYSKIE
jgi:hypothetical protein